MNSTILLVDDNKLFLEIEKEFLLYTKTDVITAYDGFEALDITKSKRPDLIFMDLEMPKMDGVACCRAIKAETALSCIPVVMVTSRKGEADRDICYSSGCDDFISKPLDRDIFLGVARRYIPDLDRRELRIKVGIKASIYVKKEIIPCSITNLSSGGAFFATEYFGTPNEVINISFTLPNGADIECHGRIVWVNRISSSMPKGIGVKFALISQYANEALLDFLKKGK